MPAVRRAALPKAIVAVALAVLALVAAALLAVRFGVLLPQAQLLIEARTHRMGPHNTSDDPTRYVDPAWLEERRAWDPVVRVRRLLQARGLTDDAAEAALVAQLKAEIDAAVEEVEALPVPGPEAMFDHVFGDPPRRVAEQRAEALGEDA